MSDNEAKPETQNGEEKSEHVLVSVATQDGKKLTFKVKWQAPLQKVFNAFCSRMSLNQDEVVFLHNSERLRKEQTLEEIEYDPEEVIECMQSQVGGF
ncbi:hypothetical protein WJX74_003694 [Apatococcus lobatus]|uniref:Ubiquitin-like domain-containing protein n=1 Tax=Apatococcus lobatus TaxID=904363 RepID=A0AAW1S3B5_9CHLO